MSTGQSLKQRWREFHPSKAALFWSCVACLLLAPFIGFTWGGWMTSGRAVEMANKAADHARAKLAATVCVQRFMAGSEAAAQLTSLKKTSAWQRDDVLEKAGWATPPGLEKPVDGAAALCAEQLVQVELPPRGQGARSGEGETVVQ